MMVPAKDLPETRLKNVDVKLEDLDLRNDEHFLIWCARKKGVGTAASKSWLLTAKTLYPHSVSIHLEAYEMEKSQNNIREAAKCFSALLKEFSNDKNVWQITVEITKALQSTDLSNEQKFLREMFHTMEPEIQHYLLVLTANNSTDPMEHCRLMLLLMKNFPGTAVSKFGPKLMETLIQEENFDQNPVNSFRKILVCDLTPMLIINAELTPKHLVSLLSKSIEFYVTYLTGGGIFLKDLPESDSKITNPWKNLFYIYEKTATKLGWELSNVFNSGWTKEMVWSKIKHHISCNPQVLTCEPMARHVINCITILFLYSLYEYHSKIYEVNTVLIEIPCDMSSNSNICFAEPPVKRAKLKTTEDGVILTAASKNIPINAFVYAYKCWDLFHSSDVFELEFLRLTQPLRVEVWIKHFLQDVYLYKGLYNECVLNLPVNEKPVKKHLHLVTSYFWLKKYSLMFEEILEVISVLYMLSKDKPSPDNVNNNSGSNNINSNPAINQSSNPGTSDDVDSSAFPCNVSYTKRHLHFLHLQKENILMYVTKLLIVSLKKTMSDVAVIDLTYGHILVLLQLDWGNEQDNFKEIIDHIKVNRRFSYNLFMKYIINMIILEEFMFLSTEGGGSISLDIMIPSTNQLLSQRRMSTRGVDKGAKEDFKMAVKRQISRSHENLCTLIMRFISEESDLLRHCLASNSQSVN